MSNKSEQTKLKPKTRTATKKRAVSSAKLELLITVVDRNKGEYYADLIQSFEVNLQTIVLAEGTATAGTLRYLGLTETGKSVILSVIRQDRLPDALAALEEKFDSVKGGKGIAFTIPFTSVIGTLIFGFLSNNKSVVKENRQ